MVHEDAAGRPYLLVTNDDFERALLASIPPRRPLVNLGLFAATLVTTTFAGAAHQGVNLLERPSRSKRASTPKPMVVCDWAGARTQRAEYGPAAVIFAQGDPTTGVMYVETGAVRLSVLSHAGKEAVVVNNSLLGVVLRD